jgi:predicted CXXCH cytochrome family protein
MKKKATKKVILLMIAIVSVLMVAQIAKAATPITNSKHDLRTASTSTTAAALKGGTDLCVYCHTPHSATSNTVPLWNRSVIVPTYTVYASTTLNATVGQPAGVSAACLTCHDGTLAVDAYGGSTGTPTTKKITSDALLGTDLSNDHPISFTYDAALVGLDSGLVTPSSATLVVTGIPLFSSKMECASCHSVHDNTNAPFLRVSNAGSALCLKCHIK